VTLHWFVHPRWFDEIGGFTKFENIDVYVEWAKKAFELFGDPQLHQQQISALSACCRCVS
jgi:beta-glucosidase/6-phospho-beta-glucosidase/beta-galactosidase